MQDIQTLVDKYIEDGVMTRQEHEDFIDAVHKDGEIDDEESKQIARIFKLIADGELVIVDEMREKFEKKRREDEAKIAQEQDTQ